MADDLDFDLPAAPSSNAMEYNIEDVEIVSETAVPVPTDSMDFAEDIDDVQIVSETNSYMPEYNSMPADSVPVMSLMPEPEGEEDALTAFNAAWKIKLDEKRQHEYEEEKKAKAIAAEELATFQSQRTVKLAAKKESNRSGEAVFVDSIKSDEQSSNLWDRVTKLIDAGGESADASKSDVGRMRKLFIQLKNEPLPVHA